jgi:predicted RNA-binding protein with PIN domain
MIIIIDAYNILKYIFHDKFITEKQRNRFVDYLVRYGKKKRHELIIVFDGGPYGLSEILVQKPVTIVYTGSQERADDAIIRLMKKYGRYDILIVSTDREITNIAEKDNIPYIDSHLFYRCLSTALGSVESNGKRKERAHKMHNESNPALDSLMESVEVPSNLVKNQEGVIPCSASGKKISKNERYIMSIVDKL